MALERVESKKRQIGARGSVSGASSSTNKPPANISTEGGPTASILRQDSKGGMISRRNSKSVQVEGELHRQHSKEPQRVSSKLRRMGFRDLDEYEEGELEKEFVDRVQKGDDDWVLNCLAAVGKSIIFSPWAGNVTRTTILYAAKQGDEDMCKILLAYGGKELLKVKDFKNRDAEHFAKLHGIDLLDLMHSSSRIDCWNHKALRSISKSRKDAHENGLPYVYTPKSPGATHRDSSDMLLTASSSFGVNVGKGGA